jgi:hypothetical protein
MKQLEIDFFFPLTEQIPLDLDFTGPEEFERERQKRLIADSWKGIGSSGSITWSSEPTFTGIQLKPTPSYIGHWNVCGKDFQIYRSSKPNWFIRTFNKILIGWEWVDD